jgi:formate dehydrogenase iron-sulfur subunit
MASQEPLAYLFDATRCIDCRACMVACSVENNVPMDDTRIWLTGTGVIGEYPNLDRASMPYHCMHCLEPACASACPVGAWSKREDGPVVYDSSRCIGCRYCMNACPFGVPHFDWNKGIIEQPLITKCTMCAHRLDVGQEPACVQTCPTHALKFGTRGDMLAEAKACLAANPDKYVNHVYGETENGGTSYLIISHVPFADLGLPDVPQESVNKTSEVVMSGTIPFALAWAGVLTAVAGLVRLRERGMMKKAAAAVAAEESSGTVVVADKEIKE